VQSTLGAGSTFSVTVPRVYRADEPHETDQQWTVEEGRVPVLLVEDDPADALAVELLLEKTVYQPLHTRSVRDAKRLMGSIRPVAILLDIVLVSDESWRLLLEVRGQEWSADIPMIVTSSTGEARKAMHLGADEYLEKPVNGDRLIEVLDRVTGRHSVTQVLVVDDEEVTHYLLRQLLPRARYRLWIATDGKTALDRLDEGSPDVVLLDLRMPGMNGFEFLSRLQQNRTWAEIPVIVLSSVVLEAGERALLRDASLIMSKSELASGTLIEKIDSVLRQNAAA